MTPNSRFIRARIVDFSGPNFAGEVAGSKKGSAKERKVRAKLRRARALKRRITKLSDKQPLGWKAALRVAKRRLAVVMVDLRSLGWKPKKPSRPRKPGEDETDAALDDIPEAEPGETEEPDEGVEDAAEPADDEAATEGNWLDGYVGAEPAKKRPLRDLMQRAERFVAARWSKPVPLGTGAQIQTRPGQRAMVATVQPGLFIVQLVSDSAAKKIAGDNVGILPLLLYPMVKNQIQKALAPKPAAPAPGQAVPPAYPPAPVAPAAGCDCTPGS